ncbi:segregation and condensation protein A [Saccharibacter floricola]|uniref:Segregation and condensation protein A n=1 Tax=Saccharibacter floricola DSM 15669 TaxID=1123227 RepID=A0ABQ0NZC6_9PROT|nr:ScpA family protein [Saccharibacter floricola]GBQ06929.1 chromosome segregation and condensation protein ScpA [Saccharibacter floricola DSM 15669]
MSNTLQLHLDGFEGPLDLLLELARAQKVDLSKISILQLAEQYLAVVEGAQQHSETLRLEQAADWLVMAAWLAWLKSRLLVPSLDEGDEAEEAAGLLQERLVELERMRRAAQWLTQQPRLGREMFERPEAENHTHIDRSQLRADLPALVLSYLKARRRGGRKRVYAPRIVRYWSAQQARAALVRLLGHQRVVGWQCLHSILPNSDDEEPVSRKAALAGALMAGLEMAKGGALELRQEQVFGEIEWRGAS